jgi:hypothetical protein
MQMSRLDLHRFPAHVALILFAALLPLAIFAGSEWFTAPLQPNVEAAHLANELDRLLQIRIGETFTIAAFPSIRAFAASDPASRAQRSAVALNELQAWVAADLQVREAFVVDSQASVVLTTGKDWNQDWKTRSFIQTALTGKLDVSPVSHDVSEFSQYYAAPILDNRGNVAGALVARVAAQELWGAVNAASDPMGNSQAILVDDNGVRLADGGDATRILAALAPLTAEQQSRIIAGQTYGAQVTIVRATDLRRAADIVHSGALEMLNPADFGASAVGAQRMTTKPWTVVILSSENPPAKNLERYWVPLLAALAGSILASFLLVR